MKKSLRNTLTTLLFCTAAAGAQAASDTTLACKNASTVTALNLKTLGLKVSADTPVGTMLHSGNMAIKFKCALDQLSQQGQEAEVYFKRLAVDEGALGYGLTLYTGYGESELATEPESIPTGKKVSTWAYTSGGTVGSYTTIELAIPYKIVKTSASMAASTALPSYVYVFSVGSNVPGKDLKFNVSDIKTAVTVE